MNDRWTMPAGLRRVSALVAIVALAVSGAKVVDDNTLPGSGFSAVATVAADPTGPPGPTGGMTDGGGSQFQPPQMPSSMPDYQGGNNQAPLDQNSGISIYNSGNPQAPQQVSGQQAGQQPQQGQQPLHGTQIPNYQTATPYTQGPGQANPDYQAQQQPQQQPSSASQGQSGTNSATQNGQSSGANQGANQNAPQNGNSDSSQTQNISREQLTQRQASLDQQINQWSQQQQQVNDQYDLLDKEQQTLDQNQQLSSQERATQQQQLDQRRYELDSKQSDLDDKEQQLSEEQRQLQEQEQQQGQQQQQDKKDECKPNEFVLPKTPPLPPGAEKDAFTKFAVKARRGARNLLGSRPGHGVDHIVPLRRLWDLFKKYGITDINQQVGIANVLDNLDHLNTPWNSSKFDNLASEWTPSPTLTPQPSPEEIAAMCGQEQAATEAVQKAIAEQTANQPSQVPKQTSIEPAQPKVPAQVPQAPQAPTAPQAPQAPQAPETPAPVTVPAQPPAPATVAPPQTAAPAQAPQPGWFERNAGNIATGVGIGVTVIACILTCVETIGAAAPVDAEVGVGAAEGTEALILALAE